MASVVAITKLEWEITIESLTIQKQPKPPMNFLLVYSLFAQYLQEWILIFNLISAICDDVNFWSTQWKLAWLTFSVQYLWIQGFLRIWIGAWRFNNFENSKSIKNSEVKRINKRRDFSYCYLNLNTMLTDFVQQLVGHLLLTRSKV